MEDRTLGFSAFRATSRFASGLAFAAIVLAASACDPSASSRNNETPFDSLTITGRLTARYKTPTAAAAIPGLQVQRITSEGRPFGLFVPTNYDPSRKWPLAVLLHGFGGSGEGTALEFAEFADAAGVIIVAPNAFFTTWDLIYTSAQTGAAVFGPDRAYIDNALKWSFDHLAVDSARVGLGGFDDGAVYALWLGLKNGDLFSRIVAFSPCSNVPSTRTGAPLPLVFISHSVNDQLAPIDTCSRTMVPKLEGFGYAVEYIEYPTTTGNGHLITPEIMAQGIQFLGRQ